MSTQEAVAFLETHGFMPTLRGPVELYSGIPAMAMERAASSRPNRITIHPRYADLDTASGKALLAHEWVHQQQFENIPDFKHTYAIEQRRVERAGLPPYANILERPAYEREVQAYLIALEEGYPPGEHVPLLLRDSIAAGAFTSDMSTGFFRALGAGLAIGLLALVLTYAKMRT